MRYLSAVTALVILIALPVSAEKIQLQWDYSGDNPDGFKIFRRVVGGQYNYTNPVADVTGDKRDVIINLPPAENSAIKYELVARAYILNDDSNDSNQVDYTVVTIPPPPPISLSGSFDRANGLIKISWLQPDDDYITDHWRVYYRLAGTEDDYSELGLIRRDNPLELTTEFNIVGQGEQQGVNFVVVAYRRSGAYSANSDVVTVDVDRRIIGPVDNLRINIEIPVT